MGLTERALRELMRILETGKFPSDDSAASDLYFAVREALENRRILSDRTAERDHLRAEVERLRAQTKAALLNAKQSQDGWNEALNERNALQSTAAGLRRALEEARQFSRDAAYGASIHAADSAICDSARRAEDVCIAALTASSDEHARRIKAEARAVADRYQKADDAAVQLLEKAKLTLEVPAAEYVPAISDAWQLIENALEKIR